MPLPLPFFISKWKRSNLSEMSAYQQHFLDLCEVLGEPRPADVNLDGTWSTSRPQAEGDGNALIEVFRSLL